MWVGTLVSISSVNIPDTFPGPGVSLVSLLYLPYPPHPPPIHLRVTNVALNNAENEQPLNQTIYLSCTVQTNFYVEMHVGPINLVVCERISLQCVVNYVLNKWTFGELLIKASHHEFLMPSSDVPLKWFEIVSRTHSAFTCHKISVAFQNHFSWNVLSKMHYIYVFETIQFLKHTRKRIIVSCDRGSWSVLDMNM